MNQQLDPTSIMQTATSFWASKVLLTAVEFDLFSKLGDGSMRGIVISGTNNTYAGGTNVIAGDVQVGPHGRAGQEDKQEGKGRDAHGSNENR